MSHYGCWNREPFTELLPLPAHYTIEVEGHSINCEAHQLHKNVFAKDCQYTLTELSKTDQGCFGCKWRKE